MFGLGVGWLRSQASRAGRVGLARIICRSVCTVARASVVRARRFVSPKAVAQNLGFAKSVNGRENTYYSSQNALQKP